MLVLSRRVSESIQIGEGILVSIVRIEGDRVRVGITAPSDIRVVRSELLAAVVEENLRAAQAPTVPPMTGWRPAAAAPVKTG
ncbi:MAG: carbon storage regulator [Chloroflexi bacterium]|nr:carbon storage regulator [Chloroflexota bacterium]